MRKLYYVVLTLIHSRDANVIKIISLALGLMMSVLLFARVAFDFSVDTCFKDYRNLYQVWSVFTLEGKTHEPQQMNMGKTAAGIFEALPDVVESATSVGKGMVSAPLFDGDTRYDEQKVTADSLFFQTMGIEVLSGNPVQDLQQTDVIFLSERLAKRMFGDENPIGKVISYNKQFNLTVKGTYATISDNSTMKPKAVISLPSIWSRNMANYSWKGGDSWYVYLRLKPGTDVEAMNKRINVMVQQNLSMDHFPVSLSLEVHAQPIRETFQSYKEVQHRRIILSILGGAILFIAAMNYVLISLSSLSRRAKAIGVHKCSGAETETIFGMFLWETAIIICCSLLLMVFIVLNFEEFVVECMNGIPLESFLVGRIIWAPLLVVILLFCIGGLIPACMFSRIPVTQVFKRYTERKKTWKRPLLFVQFAGVAFVAGVMCIVWIQLRHLNTMDLGYNKERVATAYQVSRTREESSAIQHFYEGLPYVESFTSSRSNPHNGYSGELVSNDTEQTTLSCRSDQWTENYPSFMGMTFVQGRMSRETNEVVVNETFVEKMGWKDHALDKTIHTERGNKKIVGILKNFRIGDFYASESLPFIAQFYSSNRSKVHVKLKEPFHENLQRLNKEVGEAFPNRSVVFESLDAEIRQYYQSEYIFRNITMVATVVVLFITLMGLIGFINDETQRRSKEIAIRKVNGADASSIIEMLAKDVLWTALPAVVLGTLASWYVGELWMSQFATVVGSTIPYYIMTGIVTLLMIVGVVVVKTWRIANENPVLSIKSE